MNLGFPLEQAACELLLHPALHAAQWKVNSFRRPFNRERKQLCCAVPLGRDTHLSLGVSRSLSLITSFLRGGGGLAEIPGP